MQGSIKFYNDQKGFGFIIAEDGTEIFFHITQCEEGYEPQEWDMVDYQVWEGRDGRPAAKEVRAAGGSASDSEMEPSESMDSMDSEEEMAEVSEKNEDEDDDED